LRLIVFKEKATQRAMGNIPTKTLNCKFKNVGFFSFLRYTFDFLISEKTTIYT